MVAINGKRIVEDEHSIRVGSTRKSLPIQSGRRGTITSIRFAIEVVFLDGSASSGSSMVSTLEFETSFPRRRDGSDFDRPGREHRWIRARVARKRTLDSEERESKWRRSRSRFPIRSSPSTESVSFVSILRLDPWILFLLGWRLRSRGWLLGSLSHFDPSRRGKKKGIGFRCLPPSMVTERRKGNLSISFRGVFPISEEGWMVSSLHHRRKERACLLSFLFFAGRHPFRCFVFRFHVHSSVSFPTMQDGHSPTLGRGLHHHQHVPFVFPLFLFLCFRREEGTRHTLPSPFLLVTKGDVEDPRIPQVEDGMGVVLVWRRERISQRGFSP